MNRLSREIKALLDSAQKKKELQALHSTNKAASLEELLRTNNFLHIAHNTVVIFKSLCSYEPLQLSELFSDYFAPFIISDDN